MIDNFYIADQFSLLSKLLEIHGENSFKSKAYSITAFNIEKLPAQLAELPLEKIIAIKGIGESTSKKIQEIVNTGELKVLKEYIGKTPPGVIEMLNIKGIGAKKINIIWKELGIETIGELYYACEENQLARSKGFGGKTQETIKESIEFYQKSQGSHLYAEIEPYAEAIDKQIKNHFPSETFILAGEFRRQMEIINELYWITSCKPALLQQYFTAIDFETTDQVNNLISFKGPENVSLKFRYSEKNEVYSNLFIKSCSDDFLNEWIKKFGEKSLLNLKSEEEAFSKQKLNFIPACMREKENVIDTFRKKGIKLIRAEDINALIHCHSKWSDGVAPIRELAKACIKRGWEFMVISDHSKNAAYANGLNEERIKAQHGEIEELNEELKPFKVFKGIECDILSDGSLDYDDKILSSFDLVIGSIHANLKMTEEKATSRLLKAIENPYMRILGHMTGRILLSRPGFPVDHQKIIEACAKYKVVIEINASPRRLDMAWQWIDVAIEAGVILSIDPDAHYIERIDDVRYGVLTAQKGGLIKESNLSSFSLKEFDVWLGK